MIHQIFPVLMFIVVFENTHFLLPAKPRRDLDFEDSSPPFFFNNI